LQQVRNIAQQEVKLTHAFHSKLTNNMSVAEKTLQRHQACKCWGCGSAGHVYFDRTGTIFCPRASELEVKAKFNATRKDFQECRKACTKKSNGKRKQSSNSNNISTILSTLLEVDDQLEQLKALLSSNKKARNAASSSQDFVTFPTFLCLPSELSSKPLLPIRVDTNLPHFLLPIGQSSADSNFKISVAYDTCAVLNVGWVRFHLAIAKQHPHLVKSLVWAKEQYNPLTLSGGVSQNEADPLSAKLVTTLPAIIEYYMPYPSKQGHPTSFKVAIGDNVAVNTLIGMSMICPAKFSLDLEDNVINSGILDAEPFPVCTSKPLEVST
jgi:uncharacterized Zn finger protein (UPF0148 family)